MCLFLGLSICGKTSQTEFAALISCLADSNYLNVSLNNGPDRISGGSDEGKLTGQDTAVCNNETWKFSNLCGCVWPFSKEHQELKMWDKSIAVISEMI